jgi:hypothetical protein
MKVALATVLLCLISVVANAQSSSFTSGGGFVFPPHSPSSSYYRGPVQQPQIWTGTQTSPGQSTHFNNATGQIQRCVQQGPYTKCQ